jgi:hypothetical protein
MTKPLPRWAHTVMLVLAVSVMVLGEVAHLTTAKWVGLLLALVTRLDTVFLPRIVPLVEGLSKDDVTPSPVDPGA